MLHETNLKKTRGFHQYKTGVYCKKKQTNPILPIYQQVPLNLLHRRIFHTVLN